MQFNLNCPPLNILSILFPPKGGKGSKDLFNLLQVEQRERREGIVLTLLSSILGDRDQRKGDWYLSLFD